MFINTNMAMVAYTTDEQEIVNNVKTITNDFKKILASEEESDILKVKKAIKCAKMAISTDYFDLTNDKELFDYQEAVANYTAYKLLVLKDSLSFSFDGTKNDLKAGMVEIKRNLSDGKQNDTNNVYYKNYMSILKRYFEKKKGLLKYGVCVSR